MAASSRIVIPIAKILASRCLLEREDGCGANQQDDDRLGDGHPVRCWQQPIDHDLNARVGRFTRLHRTVRAR